VLFVLKVDGNFEKRKNHPKKSKKEKLKLIPKPSQSTKNTQIGISVGRQPRAQVLL